MNSMKYLLKKITHSLFYSAIWLGLISCQPSTDKQEERSKARKVIDNAIETHGGGLFENMSLSFDFRTDIILHFVKMNNMFTRVNSRTRLARLRMYYQRWLLPGNRRAKN